MGGEVVEAMTSYDFVSRFRVHFALVIVVQELAREFQDLCQTTKSVVEITSMFRESVLLVPHYVADENMKKARTMIY